MKLFVTTLSTLLYLTFYFQPKANFLTSGSDFTNSRIADSLVLVDLYNATNGASWTNTWNLNQPMNTWFGVTLNAQGCVTALALDNNGLVGSLPASLGNLGNVQRLRFGFNEISGAIPPELENATGLRELYLNNNQLNGSIPAELGNLPILMQLYLNNNQITGSIPSELGDLSNLTQLRLGANQLSGTIPSELGNLGNLTEFYSFGNQLTGAIPGELGDLSSLTLLNLSNNQLSGAIPASLGSLPNLTSLSLNGNQLTGAIPEELSMLQNLVGLSLNNNQLSDCFPNSFTLFCNISYNFSNNPQLPWQGDFSRFCNNEAQIGATCDDGNPDASNDLIDANCTCLGTVPCRPRDSLILVDLYNATNGASWANTWNLNTPIDTWYGINLNSEECVAEIDLSNNGLTGTLPPSLGNLSALTDLDLSNNSIGGSLPSELGNLGALTHLNLGQNSFTGNLPSSLGNLTQLMVLTLQDNPTFTGGIPTEWGTLSNLQTLNLSNCRLFGNIPTELGNLGQLTLLNLANNSLQPNIPVSLGSLSVLQILDLSNNLLTGTVPIELDDISTLQELRLNDNRLSGALPDFAAFANLNTILLQNNDLSDCFPASYTQFCSITYNFSGNPELPWQGDFQNFCNGDNQDGATCSNGDNTTYNDLINSACECVGTNCRLPDSLTLVDFYNATNGSTWNNQWNLNQPMNTWFGVTLNAQGCVVTLVLNNNNLTGTLPTTIGGLQNLQRLNLENNSIGGTIPVQIGNAIGLQEIYLNNNQLTGSIPTELGNLEILNTLHLNTNQLTGSIPPALGSLSGLQQLFLYANQISGAIPGEIGNLANLEILYLFGNQLSGSIPPELEDLDNLTQLFLNNNQLTGVIPPELGGLENLEVLSINANDLSGAIPPELAGLQKLTSLTMGSNQLSGAIPHEIGDFPLLFNLSLENNQLSGSVPSDIGDLTTLGTLKLRNNNLSGTLPSALGNLQNLEVFYAEQCEFTGAIPGALGSMTSLRELWLQGNELSGSIPVALGNLNSLVSLRLSANDLTGEIPTALSNLSLLEDLFLDNQGLSGEVPGELGNLTNLKNLYLNGNAFTGEIPSELENLANIEVIQLHSNQFTGCIPATFFNLCSATIGLGNNPNLLAGDDFSTFCATGQGSCLDNYDCESAAFLPMNEDPCGSKYVAAKLDLATTTAPPPTFSCNNTYQGNDIWFKAVVPDSRNLLIKSNALTTIAPSVEAYVGSSCTSGNFTALVCAEIDSLPNVLAINGVENNLISGDTVYFRVWEQNNTLVNGPEEAVAVLSAHSLATQTDEWELCDFPVALLNDSLAPGAGNRTANSFIVQLESNATAAEVQEVRDALNENATLISTCPCLNQELELWQSEDPIDMEDSRKGQKVSSSRSKVDTTNYNYFLESRVVLGSSNVEGQQSASTVGIDDAGNVILVWQDFGRDGAQYGIFGRRFMPNGTPYANDFQINTYPFRDQDAPAVAMNQNGQSVAVWMSGFLNKDIRGQVIDNNGQPLGEEFNASAGLRGFNPKVAINNNNDFIVVWEGLDSVGLGIVAQRMEDNGDFISDTITVVNAPGNQLKPDIATNDDGSFVIAWESDGVDVDYVLYGLNDSTEYLISDIQNVGDALEDQQSPAVDMNEAGAFVIAWVVDNGGSNVEVKARLFGADGSPTIGQQTILANVDINDIDVAFREDGTFLLAWELFNGTDTDIYLQLFDGTATPITSAILVNSGTSGSQVQPSIAQNSLNDVIVSWTSYGNDGLEQGVYAQRFTIDSNQGTVTPVLDESTESGVGVSLSFSATTYAPTNPASSVKVAVFDTGIDSDHPQLVNALWQNPETNDNDNCLTGDLIGYDFVNGDGDPDDIDGHGSSVSGMVVNDFPNDTKLDLLTMKFYENQRGTVFDAVCGIYYAVNEGAKVLNLSWGFEAAQFPEILYEALKYAAERDVLIITSAGNTSKNNDLIQKYPSNFDLDNLIVVTAYQTDPDGNNLRLANYASYGATSVDIAAAGFVETTNFDGTLTTQTGTSLAAPIVARTAAVIRAKYPCLTAQQIKDCILNSADSYSSFSGLTVSGGVLNHQAALSCAASTNCLRLQVKVNLQGNFDSNTDMMSNELIRGGLVPIQSPYSATINTTESVLYAKTAIPAEDEIVDWVRVQLRDKSDNSIILAETSALLQRDGDVVDLDGESAVRFYDLPADEYFVVVKHRNHLGVMTLDPVMLTNQ